MYDHNEPTTFSLHDCENAVGKAATLTLTGTIVEARESCNGPYVMFKVDSRWGFGAYRFGIDLDALTVEPTVTA